ncbi:Chromo-like domain superfamily [Sesbania bispinosa]|nr:Chromo-like domain superfamily [Sesbania bispinosa]
MRMQANKHKRDLEIAIGEWVYLKLQPYKLKLLARKPNEKLSPRFYGPYQSSETSTHTPAAASNAVRGQELKVQPEDVVNVREDCYGNVEVLIKWKQLPACDNSWESATRIQEQFPHFHLEDRWHLLIEHQHHLRESMLGGIGEQQGIKTQM